MTNRAERERRSQGEENRQGRKGVTILGSLSFPKSEGGAFCMGGGGETNNEPRPPRTTYTRRRSPAVRTRSAKEKGGNTSSISKQIMRRFVRQRAKLKGTENSQSNPICTRRREGVVFGWRGVVFLCFGFFFWLCGGVWGLWESR